MGQIIGETGIGEMGVGETETNRCKSDFNPTLNLKSIHSVGDRT